MHRWSKDTPRSVGLVVSVGAVLLATFPRTASASGPDEYSDNYITHIGRSSVPALAYHYNFVPARDGGHPDFGKPALNGHGWHMNILANELDEDWLPIFRSTGFEELSPWADTNGERIIQARPYIASMPGDAAGSLENTPGDAITSAASFESLFRYTPGVNTRSQHYVDFIRQPDTTYLMAGSFDNLTGSPDYDYSTVLEFGFVHEEDQDAYFEFNTNGEAWMFIDGKLVMDDGWGTEEYFFYGGVASDGPIDMGQSARIEVAPGSVGKVSTNSPVPGVVDLDQSSFIDTDVYVGPEGDPATGVTNHANVGGNVDTLQYPVGMPELNPPDDLGPSTGNFRPADGALIGADKHVNSMTIQNGDTVTVSGNVRILCDGTFSMKIGSNLIVAPGSRLELWVLGPVDLSQSAMLNAAGMNPDQCFVYVPGEVDVRYGNDCIIYAHTIAPNARFWAQQRVQIFGSLICDEVNMGQESVFTIVDPSSPIDFGDDVWWPPYPMTERIDLNRLGWLQDRHPYSVQVYFANRNTARSYFNLHTNVRTPNILQYPSLASHD